MIALSVAACVFFTAANLFWNARLAGIINNVSAGAPPGPAAAASALAAMLLMSVCAYLKGSVTGLASEYMSHDLRTAYASRFASMKFAEAEKLNAGEQLSKLMNEISGVSDYLNSNLFQLFDDFIRFVVTLAWLLMLNPALTLASNLPAAAIVVYVYYSSGVISAAADESQRAKGAMNRSADTLLSLFPVIKIYGAAALMKKEYADAVSSWENSAVRLEYTKARLMSLSGVLSRLPLLLLLFAGGHMVIGGTLAVGTLYIFINLSGDVSGVFMNMPGHIAAFRQFCTNAERIRL